MADKDKQYKYRQEIQQVRGISSFPFYLHFPFHFFMCWLVSFLLASAREVGNGEGISVTSCVDRLLGGVGKLINSTRSGLGQ